MKINDKMRLDWLGRLGNGSLELCAQSVGGVYVWGQWAARLGGIEGRGLHFKSVRQAIDAAIKQETKSRALKGEKLKGGA